MKRRKRTIYEIADLARVSPATVSKVLNDREGVGADVRQRVLGIVERENFMPKTVLSDINTIAVIYRSNDMTASLFHSEYMVHIMRGVSEYVFEHGCHLLLFPSNLIPKQRDQFSLFCRKNRITGCVWCNLRSEDAYVQNLAGIVPMAVVNATFTGEKMYSLCSDDQTGMCIATKYLYSMGHRRIALCTTGLMYDANRKKRLGYHQAMEELGIDDQGLLEIGTDDLSVFSLSNHLRGLQEVGQMPTAFLTFNDTEALKIISLLHLLNLPCPQEVSVVGYDNYDCAELTVPPLTTVKQSMVEIGAAAAKLVCGVPPDCVDAVQEESGRFIFKPQLLIRGSVRKIENKENDV